MKGIDLFPGDCIGRPYCESPAERAENYPPEAERARLLETFGPAVLIAGYLEGRPFASQMLYPGARTGGGASWSTS